MSGGKRWFYVVVVDITANIRKHVEDRRIFEQALSGLFQAYPDAIGVAQVNLSQNLCLEIRSHSSLSIDPRGINSYDELLVRISQEALTPSDKQNLEQDFNRLVLLAAFKSGKDSIILEYSRRDSQGEYPGEAGHPVRRAAPHRRRRPARSGCHRCVRWLLQGSADY